MTDTLWYAASALLVSASIFLQLIVTTVLASFRQQ